MNSKYIRLITLASLLILILTFSSCGKKYLGYGTLLWSDNEEIIQTGKVVTIISESDLADIYLVNDGLSEESYQIDRWRISFFEERSEAEEKAQEIIAYKTIFARNLKDGLLIREQPDINSNRVYKMRKNQVLKVYGRMENMSTVGQYEGYWYQVLPKDGVA
ncbi:MAG: SH3 domain-containing protein, partial [Spirochaetales bacterium]|nr:SH3 domain-containing protein [Spirochaetales bacterium]